MTFSKLRIHNFGPFSDDVIINLKPIKNKRIILFGGLNGAGKTSLLTALQLVLFGKIWMKVSNKKMSYNKLLESLINRDNKGDDTWVELDFYLNENNIIHRIKRAWGVRGGGIEEEFTYKTYQISSDIEELIENKLIDAQNWYSFVDTIFPPQISELYLFDGERIEELADPKRTSQILDSAIEALFGGGVLKQLEKDLKILEKDLLNEQVAITGDEELKSRIDRYSSIEKELHLKQKAIEKCTDDKKDLIQKDENIRENLRMIGGEFFHQREEYEIKLEEAKFRLSKLNEQAILLMNQELPFHIVFERISEIIEDSEKSLSPGDISIIEGTIKQRDEQILSKIFNNAFLKEHYEQMINLLNETKINITIKGENPFLREEGVEGKRLIDSSAHTNKLVDSIFNDYEKQKRIVDFYQERLSKLPSVEQAKPLITQLEEIAIQLMRVEQLVEIYKEDASQVQRQMEDEKRSLMRYAEKLGVQIEYADTIQRIQNDIQSVKSILFNFKSTIIKQRVQKISNIALDYFNLLHRKEGMVKELIIDPENLSVSIIDDQNHTMDISRLSAGERQMLSTSLLWAIAKSSGKVLPFVIDTPLGRLDSIHRDNLITKFFPDASHQVILLSTDQEIRSEEYEKIEPFISNEYGIHFNESAHRSTVINGYPFKSLKSEELINV